jgi:methionyl-tRNA synthetase
MPIGYSVDVNMTKIFIGVAWPYANNAQHFGHLAGAYLPADIFARYHRMNGNEVLMVSGSDMHGTPTTVAAEKLGVPPEVIAERYHKINSESLAKFGISYDLFTKTSTPEHAEVVMDVFLTLLDKGYLYTAKMDSSYCPFCTRFLPDRYVEGTCPHCKNEGARSSSMRNARFVAISLRQRRPNISSLG